MDHRTLPAGFIAPCLPTKIDKLPSGSQWLHEIKHDGFRIIARKTGAQVRLYSRPGNDLTHRFPLIVETLARLRSRSCIIDGEVSLGPLAGLAQVKEPGLCGGETRGRGRLGALMGQGDSNHAHLRVGSSMKIARHRGMKKAIVALARRLAVIMHRMWV